MMKYYATKHKNKTPKREMDGFQSNFFYLFIFAALKVSIF